MKILFFDDDYNRFRIFSQANPDLVHMTEHASTYGHGVACLDTNKYDIAFLDHDLDFHIDPNKTGKDFVDHIIRNNIRIDTIYCHSMNFSGRMNMISALRSAGYNVIDQPFAWSMSYEFGGVNEGTGIR